MGVQRSSAIAEWLEERAALRVVARTLLFRNVPMGVGVLYTLGFAALFVFTLQVATGTVLALYYAPTPDHAYESVVSITNEVAFGRIVRGLHHWGSSAMVVLVGAHLVVVFSLAAYKRPREMTWIVGVALLAITLGFAFTGYLLPWDEKAYWATAVGTNMMGTVPVVGEFIVRVARGGPELGAAALTRFYAVHVLILPGAIASLIAIHVALVIWHGVSVPPSLWNEERQAAERRRFAEALGDGSDDADRYTRFKQAGRPFWPEVIVEDLVVATIAFLALLALTLALGVPLEAQADQSNSSYIPRPEWYFLFLFQLLRYFPGQLEWVGVVLLPSLAFLTLLLLPFIDRGPERRLKHRGVARTVAVVLTAGFGFLTTTALLTTPPAVAEERGIPLTAAQILGRTHFRQYCTACHGEGGEGTVDGPSLRNVASRNDANFIHLYIEDPQRMSRGALMPSFSRDLGHQQVEEVTQYVLTLGPVVAR